jgi:hypothetical protein
MCLHLNKKNKSNFFNETHHKTQNKMDSKKMIVLAVVIALVVGGGLLMWKLSSSAAPAPAPTPTPTPGPTPTPTPTPMTDWKVYPDKDFGGSFDFPCPGTTNGGICSMKLSLDDAKKKCESMGTACKAFTMAGDGTVYFKNDASDSKLTDAKSSTLYVKQ